MGYISIAYYIATMLFRIRVTLGIIFLSISIFAVAAPMVQSIIGYPAGESIYSTLSGVCHQYPTRSFWILSRPFALCARCFSGYIGLAIGFFIISWQWKYHKRLAAGVLFLIPAVADGLIQLLTSYESANITRSITGLIGGIGVFLIIFPYQTTLNNRGNK